MKFKTKRLIDLLNIRLPEASAAAFRDAIKTGNADSAWAAADMADDQCVPSVAVAFYLVGLRGEALRAPVQKAWFWTAYGTRVTCETHGVDPRALFRACAFEIPPELPDAVTVYRGTRGVSVDTARRGMSWATDRNTAVTYTQAGAASSALLLRRTVAKSDILFAVKYAPASEHMLALSLDVFGDMGFEVIFDAEPAGEVDGCEAEWLETSLSLSGELTAALRPGPPLS